MEEFKFSTIEEAVADLRAGSDLCSRVCHVGERELYGFLCQRLDLYANE